MVSRGVQGRDVSATRVGGNGMSIGGNERSRMGAWGYVGIARTDCREREGVAHGWAGIVGGWMGVRWRCMDPVIAIEGQTQGSGAAGRVAVCGMPGIVAVSASGCCDGEWLGRTRRG